MKRIDHELWMNLNIVGDDKDFIISPDIIRGWMAPDAHFGTHITTKFVLRCGSLADPEATTALW